MDPIRLAPGLELPAEDLLESAIAIIAKRGRGKSGALKVLMEELTRVGLPFVALDPVGILWGIRSNFDGTGPGLPVLVIGGEHGDVPLHRKNGAAVAQRIIQENISAVIDFSEEPKAAYREFVRDFSHELFRKNDTPRMVILEEAPELVPQKVIGDRAETFEGGERLVSRGRNKGLGVVLVSQRAATLNKDVLTQVDVLIVLGLAAPQDRKALGDWIRAWDVENQAATFDGGLAGLHRQEAWVWSPEAFGGLFQKIKFRDFTTFHPDKTHLRRMGFLKVRAVTADVAGVVARFEGHRSKSTKEEDVEEKERKAYESKIRTLEDQLELLREQLRQRDREPGAPASRAPPSIPVSTNVDPHDVRVTHELPSVTAVHKLPLVETNTEQMVGRIALLIAEGFWENGTAKIQADVGRELVRRGFGSNFSSGGLSVRLSEAMGKMT
ncbi:MAG: hypothetical protein L3J96_01130, partial [Thermoplasmata archaeon]|nr:hypothetical protein [Thermoplasmata archaeon]